MGALRPSVSQQPVGSQATPFAQDFLSMLQRELTGGGPIGGNLVRDVPDPSNFITGLSEVHGREMKRGAADISESFGAQGARFGSTIGRAQTDFQREGAQDFGNTLAQLELMLQELGQQRDLGILGMFGQMAGLGVHPDQTLIEDSGLKTLMDFLGPIAASAARPGA